MSNVDSVAGGAGRGAAATAAGEKHGGSCGWTWHCLTGDATDD